MKIESIDFFYLALPHVRDIGDGSQDALVVRVRGGGLEGWGECEASPLVSIAAYVTPMSIRLQVRRFTGGGGNAGRPGGSSAHPPQSP